MTSLTLVRRRNTAGSSTLLRNRMDSRSLRMSMPLKPAQQAATRTRFSTSSTSGTCGSPSSTPKPPTTPIFRQSTRPPPHYYYGAAPKSAEAVARSRRNVDTFLYAASVLVGFLGLTYAAVPLYRLFCQATGLGGTVRTDAAYTQRPEKMIPQRNPHRRKLKITFNADTSRNLPWRFVPLQNEVYVDPGETSLVFYAAENTSDRDVVGISTYNVVPMKAGAFFNKIQCFCFEEQKLRAGEQVDMPVFFFIDPAFAEDPNMRDVTEITLSYTFFRARQGVPYHPGSGVIASDGESVDGELGAATAASP